MRSGLLCLANCILASLLFVSLFAQAQEPIYELFKKSDGLRDQSLYHCFQDSKNQMWVGSDFGVSLVNGQEVRRVESRNEMPEMAVLKICEDFNRNVWFLTMNGSPIRFDGKEFQTQWGDSFSKRIRGSNYLSAFAAVSEGSVLFGTQDGRAFQIFSDGSHRFLFSQQQGSIHFIEVVDKNHFFFHFSKVNSIAEWNEGKLTIHSFTPLLDNWFFGTLRTTKLKDGRFIFGVENRVAIVERSGDTLRKTRQIFIPEKNICYVGEDWQNNIWIGTNEGAIRYHSSDTLLQSPTRFLSGKFVSSVCRDHENGLWFTTNEGLFHCKNEFVYSSHEENCSTHDEATSIFLANNGSIFLGFRSGKVQEINRKTLSITNEYPNTFDKTNPQIIRFQESQNGEIIAAGFGGLIKIQKGQIRTLATNKFADFSLFRNKASACLFSTWSSFELNHDWEHTVSSQLSQAQVSQSNRCLHCKYDNKGTLWVSTFSEILRVSGISVDTIFSNPFLDPSYSNTCIHITKEGWLMLGTSNQGIYILTDKKTIHLNDRNGLLDNHVLGIHEDSSGTGWIHTAQGLTKISLKEKEPTVVNSFSKMNLFADKEVHDILILNDTMWAAAGNGFVMLPIMPSKTQQPLKARISSFLVNNEPFEIDQPIRLSHQNNNIRIQFDAITFSDPKLVEYRYRITNVSDSFQTTYSQTIDLPGLLPNSYTLEIQAKYIYGGDWGNERVTLHFEILPPYWQETWFLMLEFFVACIVILAIIFFIFRNVKRKNVIRESLMLAKHNALISQMNPHFVFNSLNSIQNFILNKNTELANNYLADFASLMRSILVNGRSSTLSISDEVQFLNLYLKLESLRMNHKFEFSINVSKGILPGITMIPTMMLQPLVENAIWHGMAHLEDRRGVIQIDIRQKNGVLECIISDNGIGRKKAAELSDQFGRQHKSLASTIMMERIALMNTNHNDQICLVINDLKDSEENAIGTEVRLFIPLVIISEKKT